LALAGADGKSTVYAGALVSNDFHKTKVSAEAHKRAIFETGAREATHIPVY